MRLIALLALTLLAACARPMAEVVMEPAVVEEAPAAGATATDRCLAGDDDGIGGTGCKLD